MADQKEPTGVLPFPNRKQEVEAVRANKAEDVKDFVVGFLEEYEMVYGLVIKVMGDKIRQKSNVQNELLKILEMDKQSLFSMIEKYMDNPFDIDGNPIADEEIEEYRTKILMMYDIYHKIGIHSQTEIDRLNTPASNVTVITPRKKPKLDK